MEEVLTGESKGLGEVLYQECVLEEKEDSNVDANARVKTKVGILCLVNIEEKVLLKLTRLCCVMMRINNISKLIDCSR